MAQSMTFGVCLVPYLPTPTHGSLLLAQSMGSGPALSLHPSHLLYNSLLLWLNQWLWAMPCPLPHSLCPWFVAPMAQLMSLGCTLSPTFLPPASMTPCFYGSIYDFGFCLIPYLHLPLAQVMSLGYALSRTPWFASNLIDHFGLCLVPYLPHPYPWFLVSSSINDFGLCFVPYPILPLPMIACIYGSVDEFESVHCPLHSSPTIHDSFLLWLNQWL